MKYLQKTYILLSFLSMFLLVFCYCSPFPLGGGDQDDKDKDIIKNVNGILSRFHFSPQEINDEFSEKVYDSYMENLDNLKTFFKGGDIEHFKQYRDQLDDFYKNQDLTFYHETVDTLYNRIGELKDLTVTLTKKPFDYTVDETFDYDYKNLDYTKTQKEWEDRWRKRLKYNTLQEILLLEQSAKDTAYWKKEDSIGLKKDVFDPRNKNFTQLEVEARKKVGENMSEFFRRFQTRKKKEWFSIYMNSFTHQYDPHTDYFSPKENEDFEVAMSGQLEGIGAQLTDKKGYPTITKVIVGGPAWKQGDLEADDQITKVSQGGEEPVNVVGMLLEDAIRLIRGKKGSTVILTVKKKDGSFKQIPIVRDIIELDETFAKSAIVTDKNGNKYGVLNLPSFYLNYDGKGHDASDDVKKQIEYLKESGVKGIAFDLRNNGGGDLSECVQIVGHFIPKGPVVKVLRSDGEQREYSDDDGGEVVWDGPMAVMVNEFSASASEIMAAALQDYKRAIIVGSPKTYGKGTVQTMRPINLFLGNDSEYGALKFTIQKFYRVNGGSTQLKGVASDIVIPDRYTYLDISETAEPSALPWDQIEPSKYNLWHKNGIDYNAIKAKSKQRLAKMPQIAEIEQYARWMKEIDKDKVVHLNYKKFKEDFDKRDKQSKRFENLNKYKNGLKISSPIYEEALVKNDTVLKARRDDWHKGLAKDIYLQETINVLSDIK
ncbi:carboxy terminal-processing peptidase [Weeksellaceae bacterium TAE3-ERU29]|nr:carboxy terminal-processing peptidase [Weeksellaceae bacterium TAE3-ERU29]